MNIVELSYKAYGNAEAPPLLILHGLFASSRNWHTLAGHFAEGFRVFALDMRNHGASPHAKPMGYPEMAGDIVAFLDRHDLHKASFIGHSMGGKAAMWLALQAPQRVDRLVVADIAPVGYRHSYTQTMAGLKSLPLDKVATRKDADAWLADAIPDVRMRQFLLQNLMIENGVYRWRINLDVLQEDSARILGFPEPEAGKRFDGPALFLKGERSNYVLTEHVPLIRGLFPAARIETLPDAGHWLHADQPDRFAEKVVAFLAD